MEASMSWPMLERHASLVSIIRHLKSSMNSTPPSTTLKQEEKPRRCFRSTALR